MNQKRTHLEYVSISRICSYRSALPSTPSCTPSPNEACRFTERQIWPWPCQALKEQLRLRPRVKMWELSLSRFWAAELCRLSSMPSIRHRNVLTVSYWPNTDILGNLLQKAAAELTPEAKKWASTFQRQTKRRAKNKSTVNAIKYGHMPTQVCTVPMSTSEDKRFQANNFHLLPLSFLTHSNSSCSSSPITSWSLDQLVLHQTVCLSWRRRPWEGV